MADNSAVKKEIEAFLADWTVGAGAMKESFKSLVNCVSDLEDVSLSFVARAGVSYSLRPKHAKQKERNLFGIIDVIDDVPDERWLSVCFYGDMISDPEERGEVIPGGLSGDDGYCFDMYEADEEMTNYIKARLLEACEKAAG